LKERKVFVANPYFILNGRYFPVVLAKLFDEVLKEESTTLSAKPQFT